MKGSPIVLGCLFFLSTFISIGQKYNTLNFTTTDGLPSQIVNDVFQDKDGYFWFATQDGVSIFDGHEFTPFQTHKKLEGVDAVSVQQDENGTIYIGTNTNGLFIYDYRTTINLTEKNGLPSNVIRRLFIDRENILWILTSKGVVKYKNNQIVPFEDTKKHFRNGVLSMTETNSGEMWFGTQGHGLVRYNKGKFSYIDETKGIDDPYIFSLNSYGDSILAGTTNQGVYLLKKDRVERLKIPEINSAWISNILFRSDKMYIISSVGLVIVGKNGNYQLITDSNGLTSNDLYNGNFDRENNLWLTSGNGVSCLRKENILLFDKDNGLSNEKVTALCAVNSSEIAIGTYGSGINILDHQGQVLFKMLPAELENVKITSIEFIRSRNELWVGTEQAEFSLLVFTRLNGNYKLSKRIRSIDKVYLQTITRIESDKDENIWIGTFNAGLFKIKGKDTIHYSTKNILPSNEVFTFTINRKGEALISLYQKGLFKLTGNTCTSIYHKEHLTDKFILSLFEDEKGVLYIGTKTNGLVVKDGERYMRISTKDGLLSNTISGLALVNDKLWVGTNRGFNILSFKNGRIRSLMNLDKRSGLKGTDIQHNALLYIGESIWSGSTVGLSRIDPISNAIQVVKPIISLKNVKLFFEIPNWTSMSKCNLNKHGLPTNLELNYNENHLTFEFVSLSTGANYYSYFLEGQDKDWTPYSERREVTFSNLPPGVYTFKLKTIDNLGIESDVLSIPIIIHSPFWQTWWFRISILVLIGGITFSVIRYRERSYRIRQADLERTVSERTKEVVQQRVLVELKNKEIVDSISYAKRIQNAMLPTAEVLSEDWNDIFVLYLPKDIVAGDFYWSEKVAGKQLIAVADCTGHGVPGAMVSVVCNNALNRSIREYGLYEPGKLLDKTRELILEEFSKYQEDVNDGMDISIVMFDPDEKQLFWAGANLPLWIIRSNGEFEEIKGDKQPVGKHIREINYTEHKVDLSTGDSIYMSTDGYADQFGGPQGKKLKAAQLKSKLSEIHHYKLAEQKQELIKTFENWKGSHEQVDDVCVIGIRF